MKLQKIALTCALLPCFLANAGQEYYEARSDAMGGAGVAASNKEGAAFVNPALLAINAHKDNSAVLLIPVLGVDMADSDDMIDKFDSLIDSYDALTAAIDAENSANITKFRDDLVGDLESLKGTSAYASAGLGFSVAIPHQRMPMAIFYKSYVNAVGVADIAQSDIDTLNNLDPENPPKISDLDSQGQVVGGAVSDLGVALSFPLSIVNMPISVGISPKLQRIDTYNYIANANNFDASDFDDVKYRNDETNFNLDIGVAMQPFDGLTLGLSGRNLINHDVDTIEVEGQKFTYRVEPLVTAGVAFDWNIVSVTTDIDLIENKKFKELDGTQYWRLGGEVRAFDWMALRLGYRHDMKDSTANLYSLGTGFAFGDSFFLDFTGMFGDDNAVGGVLQTSYHF
ncbi:conjugal transfer protein TraF [Shewanella schlegeliana]|uniref:Conjugal transfer protein TraF n=1 Tax=Shewanella schlegeliana TaxID=190308 RepID=A0ABS1T443_9GAMM|nr:conjugal transfer protein TraF [Shewanella schlegeliana]MBL4915568.1 conjugal transfer protein TraF [Shewanella schlegeliana]MCL1111865.1 conjugal transfer protein TraF [Shewanella schlegeliana]